MSDGTVLWHAARSDAAKLDAGRLFAAAEADFARYEIVKDVVDEFIDLALNYRQSGHPGGSRSKVHLLLALMLSGAMRWDIRRPWLPSATASCSRPGTPCRSSTRRSRCSTRPFAPGTSAPATPRSRSPTTADGR